MPRFATTKLAMTQKGRFHKTHLACRTILRIAVGLSWLLGESGVGVTLSVMTALESPKSAECLPKAESYLLKVLLYLPLASPYPPHTPLAAHYIARQYRARHAHTPHLAAILGFGV